MRYQILAFDPKNLVVPSEYLGNFFSRLPHSGEVWASASWNTDLSQNRRDTSTLASNLDHITTTNQKNWNFLTFFMFNLKAKIPGLEPKLVWGASIGKSLKNRLLFNSILSWLERCLLHQILVSVMHFSFLFPNLVLDFQSVKRQGHSGLPKTLSQNVQNRPPWLYLKIPKMVSLKSV